MSNNFSNLVDLKKLEDLLKQFSNTMGIAISILDNPSQEVLISVNWNNLCKNFYRNNLEANKNCIASDQELYEKLKKNPKLYISTCKNGLIHGSIPIIIDNEFLAVLHIGQVFFDIPDLESFKKQAAIYGFDEKPFIDAIKEIPITSKDQFKLYSQTLDEFAIFIGEMGKANKLLKKEISEKIKAEQLLQDSLCKLEETNIKLQETHINKNKFISDMSHELRTPLNAIIGFSQTLNMQYFGNLNDKQTEYVKLINKSGLH
ncbi:MAG: PocR ligand-binding domain-containing protein, partial [Cyanobacteriota bacterium]